MRILTSLLAQTSEETAQKIVEIQKQIAEIQEKLDVAPDWAFRLWPLLIFIAVAVVLLFQRQKKIAQNQVDLAKVLEQMLEK